MKKVSGFFVLLLVVGATLSFLNFLSPTCASWFSDLIATNCGDKATLIAVSRKLKESDSGTIKSRSNNKGDIGQVTLNDYNPIDPVPSSSKASINPGPIEHGTPLNPYIIPKPSPPNHPKPGDSN
uniref:Transmembrane protein n=1 Tax=Glycine max TaxID=3847 RepID=C6T3L4_SOYBN|nr:unknown [Glycine max]